MENPVKRAERAYIITVCVDMSDLKKRMMIENQLCRFLFANFHLSPALS
jgi:hypothetical protein